MNERGAALRQAVELIATPRNEIENMSIEAIRAAVLSKPASASRARGVRKEALLR
jgi:hypothetical protein